ncbi:proto-oncogene c-Fos-like [Hypomesus transpacificus]|uniref:proto-oncogene c-Fos-like n=1 Tax=Hypomesus transpacificus TaxID=137520 RepID=UPI001F075186|nr:proto-oncogene c-Fos-like [Hypomesus transpacificus]
MYPDSSPDYDSSSSCSTTSSAGDTPVCSQNSPDSLSSASSTDGTSQKDVCAETGASSSTFVPTVTAISTSPDLQWMVQPTVLTSDTPSPGRNQPRKVHGALQSSHRAGGCKRQSTGKKEHKKQPSSEEDERRKIRRERNKIAAAKCRNRRRELTDTLQSETDKLEDDKTALETEIADLLKEKERLEQILASHQPTCKLSNVDGDIESMLQDPPASPHILSILDHSKLPEGGVALEGPLMQDIEAFAPNISATAILGNSNILLCATATIEEPMKDLRGDDLEDLVPSLELTNTSETAVSVPDIDLGGPFCVSDWETLYKSVANDLEPLSTPFVSSSPTCSSYRSAFSFSCSEIDFLAESLDGLKGSLGRSEFTKDSLHSPTLLAL